MRRYTPLVLLSILSLDCGQTTTSTTNGTTEGTTSTTEGATSTTEGTTLTTDGTTSTTSSGASSTGATITETDSEFSTTEIEPDLPPPCSPHPYHDCVYPAPCELTPCGTPDSPFQEDGCMRPACKNTPCEPGYVCHEWNSGFADYDCGQYKDPEYGWICSCGGDPVPGNASLLLCFPT